jgi:hypothetical protein
MWWLTLVAFSSMLGGLSLFQQEWQAALLVSIFSAYICVIVGSFALWYDPPDFIRLICIGEMEESLYQFMWPSFEDLPSDRIDKTWRIPAIFAVIETIAFFQQLMHRLHWF